MSNKRQRLLSLQCMEGSSLMQPQNNNLNNENGQPLSHEMLKSWQDNQIAAAIEDNTINLVLEQYLTFFENRPNPDTEMVEDQAVLMAINEHGLQNSLNSIPEEPEVNGNEIAMFENSHSSSSSSTSSLSAVNIVPTNSVPHREEEDEASHIDFIEAAVGVAIQKKGLTPYSIQMSPTR